MKVLAVAAAISTISIRSRFQQYKRKWINYKNDCGGIAHKETYDPQQGFVVVDSRFYEAERERILEQVRKTLDDLYPAKICKFSKVCRGYSKEAYTCAHEGEAIWYCGLYRQHEGTIKIGEMGKMMKGTEFGDFDI